MPFKSEAQRRFFHAAEARGELPKGTAARWEDETPKAKRKRLPMHVKKTAAYEAGVIIGMAKAISELQEQLDKTQVLSLKELMAIKDPEERKRYLADMSADNQRGAMDRGNTTRAAVAAQNAKGR